ncbi:MAG: hypothetical protein H6834_14580 [Planctomycetes bacterium]|nr:hypothetical protein [Planctomycetota bacterium]
MTQSTPALQSVRSHHAKWLTVVCSWFLVGIGLPGSLRAQASWKPDVWIVQDAFDAGSVASRSLEMVKRFVHVYERYVAGGHYVQAEAYFDSMLHVATAHHMPRWVVMEAHFGLAVARLGRGDLEAGGEALERAVAHGFAGATVFHTRIPASTWDDPRVRRAYENMTWSEADAEEFQWFLGEAAAIEHDTTMMIAHNAGRLDDDYTQVPAVAVPSRATESSFIESMRWALLFLQDRQRQQVMTSDTMRIQHNTNMAILRGANPSPQQVLQSRMFAQERDRKRMAEVRQRAFRPSGNASVERAAIPPLGSIEVEAQVAPAQEFEPVEGDFRKNPLRDLRVGDHWDSELSILVQGEVAQRQLVRSWITGRDGDRVSLMLRRDVDGKVSLEDEFTTLRRTYREQLAFDFGREEPITVHAYEEKRTQVEFRGESVRAVQVDAEFDWTLNGDRQRWTYRGVFAPSVFPADALLMRLDGPSFSLQVTLLEFGRKGD